MPWYYTWTGRLIILSAPSRLTFRTRQPTTTIYHGIQIPYQVILPLVRVEMDNDQSFELYQAPVMAREAERGDSKPQTRDEVEMARLGKKQVLKVRSIIATLCIDVSRVAYLWPPEEFWVHVDAGLQLHYDGNVGSNSNVGNSVVLVIPADGSQASFWMGSRS